MIKLSVESVDPISLSRMVLFFSLDRVLTHRHTAENQDPGISFLTLTVNVV
jgi:hypothetical protein